MKKVKFGSRTYKKRAIEVANDFAPTMYPCYECGNPVADGYVCRFCGFDNSDVEQEDDKWYLNDILDY